MSSRGMHKINIIKGVFQPFANAYLTFCPSAHGVVFCVYRHVFLCFLSIEQRRAAPILTQHAIYQFADIVLRIGRFLNQECVGGDVPALEEAFQPARDTALGGHPATAT